MRYRRSTSYETIVILACTGLAGVVVATLTNCSSTGSSNAAAGGTDGEGSGGFATSSSGGTSSSASGGATAIAGCTSGNFGGTSSDAWPVVDVDLLPEKDGSLAATQVIARPWDGPLVPDVFTKTGEVGPCQLLKVANLLCEPQACDPAAMKCVGDNQWARLPTRVAIGDLTFSGLTLKAGGSNFTLSPIANNYQAAGATAVAFPPCAIGGDVTVSGSGNTASAFSVTAKCVEPLVVTGAQPLPFEASKPVQLTWTAPSAGTSRIAVEVDISHHGGLKGLIRCDAPDTGSLTIDASLVTGLIGLGTAGFPEAALTRYSTATTAVGAGKATLNVRAFATAELQIPGVVSCNTEKPCPTGQVCTDAKCQ